MVLPIEIETRMDEIRSEVERGGAELVEVLFRRAGQKSFLTFLVDKKGGITLEECAEVNRRLGAYFDRLEENGSGAPAFLQGTYFLEVNSPGLDRHLKTPADFERVAGEMLRVQTRDERGTVTTTVGRLAGLTEVGIELEAGGVRRSFRFDEVFKATREVSLKKQV